MSITEKKLSLKEECAYLAPLASSLKKAGSVREKVNLLNHFSRVIEFLNAPSPLHSFLDNLSPERELVMKAVMAIGQAEHVLAFPQEDELPIDGLQRLVEDLVDLESFYQEIGGIVGYHFLMLQCLAGEGIATSPNHAHVNYHDPEGVDISEETLEIRQFVIAGIKSLPEMAEIYPVGGAADRLNLQDERSGAPLPAAKLFFCGKTLLEGLIDDLQAREYLHYKLFGAQLCTPIVMMTSQEKDNHAQILSICVENRWFGREQNSFRFFSQPSVPAMNKQGEWCLQGSLQLLLKPSGHGVIWKLARTSKTFDWLLSQGRKKALVRQINNPLAGIDRGLLAFTGFGCRENKIFGFAACPRRRGAAEGINVLRERYTENGEVEYLLTNVEYSDFQKLQRLDLVERKYANTNILFIDLKEVESAVSETPFPGALVNPKKMTYRKGEEFVEEEVARLESTMQNIADCFPETLPGPLPSGKRRDGFKTYLTINHRKKTISTIKRSYSIGSALDETPEGCFLDFVENGQELLLSYCKMKLMSKKEQAGYPLLFFYHPALGPLYSIIAQKVRGGKIWAGSELNLKISEIEIVDLQLDGSLRIEAENITGHPNRDGVNTYSEKVGKCVLKSVKVLNEGINRNEKYTLWKGEIIRNGELHIHICGDGEFFAENVTFIGSHIICVEAGYRTTAKNEGGRVAFFTEKISKESPSWRYTLTEDFHIQLKK